MSASERKHPLLSPWIWIAIGVCLLLGAVELLFDPISTIINLVYAARIRAELPAAQARWEAQGIGDYRLVVSGYNPLVCIVTDQTITVRGGTPPPKGQTLSEQMCTVPRSIPEGFQKIERSLRRSFKGRLRVVFDAEYGYVSSYSFDCNTCNGLLCPTISDCGEFFRFSNFKPLGTP